MDKKIKIHLEKVKTLMHGKDPKKAYKDCLFRYNLTHDPDLKELLIKTHWIWIRALVNNNDFVQAKKEIQVLLALAPFPKEYYEEATPLFFRLGIPECLPESCRNEFQSQDLQAHLLDMAICDQTKNDTLSPELQAECDLILTALNKIANKEDEDVLLPLKEISFQSLCSEWVLFVRGLLNWYQNDQKIVPKAWERLKEDRIPYLIVQNLLSSFQRETEETSGQNRLSQDWRYFSTSHNNAYTQAWERYHLHTSICEALAKIQKSLSELDYQSFFQYFTSIKSMLIAYDPTFYQRVFNLLLKTLKEYSNIALIAFVQQNLPLPYDPHGNLTLANSLNDCEKIDGEPGLYDSLVSMRSITKYYINYAEVDLIRIPDISADCVVRIQSIIYNQVALIRQTELATSIAIRTEEVQESEMRDEYEDYDNDFLEKLTVHIQKLKEQIVKEFEKTIARDPDYIDSYLTHYKYVNQYDLVNSERFLEQVRTRFPNDHHFFQLQLEYYENCDDDFKIARTLDAAYTTPWNPRL